MTHEAEHEELNDVNTDGYEWRIGICIVMCLVVLGWTAVPAGAQYFGKNKVQYQDFTFQVLESENFQVYFYPDERRGAFDATRMIERWYSRLSRIFDYKIVGKSPLILYANSADFQQTTVINQRLGQGTGGVTEPLKQRMVIPLSGSYSDINHVLGHELAHVFHYDIRQGSMAGRAGGGRGTPLWFIEGMSEYLTIGSDSPHTAMWLRDALRRDTLPTLREISTNPDYFPYRWGHAFWAYVGSRWGDESVGAAYKRSVQIGWKRALVSATGVELEALSEQWKQSIRDAYGRSMEGRTAPAEVGRRLELESGVNVSPSISPDGETVAFLSRRDIFSMGLYLADAETGDIIRKLSDSYRDEHFDALRFIDSAGSWSPDGSRIAFVVFSGGDNAITVFDTGTGEVDFTISDPSIDAMANPAWSPDGSRIAFNGSHGGATNLYIYSLDDGAIDQVTDDRYADMQPAWSPDGETIAIMTDRGGDTDVNRLAMDTMHIGLLDVDSRDIRILPLFGRAKNINPQFSPDGASVYFISDADGYSDIYRYSLDNGSLYRVTNVVTGISGYTALSPAFSVSPDNGRMVFSLFDNAEYYIHVLDQAGVTEEEVSPGAAFDTTGRTLPPVDRQPGAIDNYLADADTGLPSQTEYAYSDYDPSLQLDYIGMPALGIVADRYGTSLGGGLGAMFSDMLGEHVLGLEGRIQGQFEDFGAQTYYINRDKRLNWGLIASRIPYSSTYMRTGKTNIDTGDGSVPGTRVQQITEKVYVNKINATSFFPFSMTRRLEFAAGYEHRSYDKEKRELLVHNNRVIDDQTSSMEAPPALDLYSGSLAFTGDTSYFGLTSPMRGSRYRFEVEPTFGSLQYQTVIADYRRYFFTRHFTVAMRLLHYGKYGRDSDHDRVSPVFLGYRTFVRGYELDSFDLSRSGSLESSDAPYPEFDRLIGTRIGVMNLEFRIPLVGTEEYGVFGGGFLPMELTGFLDGGVAWTGDTTPQFTLATDSQKRIPVFSAGVTTRLNLMNMAIVEVYWAYPFQHPTESGHFGFQLTPGW